MSTSQEKKLVQAIKAVSLFSGCGGSDFALSKAGYTVTWANDLWDKACETHQDNLPNSTIECGDIKGFTSFPSADLLVGCYPCQGYTQGGKRDWNAPVNFLYREFDRVLKSIQPKAFVVENVIGMTFGANKERLLDQLDRYGANYSVKHAVLNAKDYGVAQNRRRVFLVGVHKDLDFTYEFPRPTHGPNCGKPYKTQAKALKGLKSWPEGEFNTEPLHWYYLSRRRRCDWDEPSPCIVGHWRHVPLHPMSPPLQRINTDEWQFEYEGPKRRLSFKECAALQGFPRGFKWRRGNVRDKFQMIGNAVPPPLFGAVLGPLSELWR
jgi:DNA (cytosine-5)-methyltransferase 1